MIPTEHLHWIMIKILIGWSKVPKLHLSKKEGLRIFCKLGWGVICIIKHCHPHAHLPNILVASACWRVNALTTSFFLVFRDPSQIPNRQWRKPFMQCLCWLCVVPLVGVAWTALRNYLLGGVAANPLM